MRLTLNGRPIEAGTLSLLELLEEQGVDVSRSGVAVAVNADVVPRAEWGSRSVEEGDEIEVITAMQGG